MAKKIIASTVIFICIVGGDFLFFDYLHLNQRFLFPLALLPITLFLIWWAQN